jgi:small subunit ribosomal protein S6
LKTVTSTLYEGMFLIDAARAGSDWDGIISAIKKILEKFEAEIVSIKKWDDRKLAYDIKGQSRGVYILCYFRVDGQKISDIEKNVQLSEQIMRVLILNAEQMTEEDIQKDTPALKAEKEEQKTVEQASEQQTEEKQSSEEDSVEKQEVEQVEKAEEAEQSFEENNQDSQTSESDVAADEKDT